MTELEFHAYARSVWVSVVPDRSRRTHTQQIGARSDKEVLEEGGGGGGGEGGEGGEEPDPFVETALHCMPQSKKDEVGVNNELTHQITTRADRAVCHKSGGIFAKSTANFF